MPVLTSQQRKLLDDACVRGRHTSEQAVRAALGSLAVTAERPPAHLSEQDRQLRRGLRAKSRQLGDQGDKLDLLIAECAYEQWHRLLFARFLAENNLLIHPEYRAPVTLEDCEELADSLGEPDGWAVAGRFATEILPGIFRLDDPCVQLRLAPEGRLALEGIVAGLPAEVLLGDDALGWVYQFWQRERKEEVNESERRIGGADLAPVTQLFTERYMVRFLIENSLGAWWATRHPDSPLIKEWEYLRIGDTGAPAVGSFEDWPATVAGLTVIDPCCGSGHFLVEAFEILSRMRAEEEGVDLVAAQDAVLRDNLFGLELDPRCVQIAMFGLALAAWKSGAGWRQLPVPNVACSGVPTNASAEDWAALAAGDRTLEAALSRLHILFQNADTLGSLIDPKRAVELIDPTGMQRSFDDANWDDISPVITKALARETDDPAAAVLGADALGVARAADYLSRHYTLLITNPPFLSSGKQAPVLRDFLDAAAPDAAGDLAIAMPAVWMTRASWVGLVTPQNWQEKSTYEKFRRQLLRRSSYRLYARCGNNVWQNQAGKQPFKIPTVLSIIQTTDGRDVGIHTLDIGNGPIADKPDLLKSAEMTVVSQRSQLDNPESRILGIAIQPGTPLIGDVADCYQGTSTGDTPRYVFRFWELPEIQQPWCRWLSSSVTTDPFDGRQAVVRWDRPGGVEDEPGSAIRGRDAWGREGVSVTQMGNLSPSLYLGERFDTNAAAIVPRRKDDVLPLWCYVSSADFSSTVRAIVSSTQVTNGALALVPFDVAHWRAVAGERFPGGRIEQRCSDPAQWLFDGRPEASTEPLQVAVGRLLGYAWPAQPDDDDLTPLADADGIVCLPSVRGERTAADRLQGVLAHAFGGTWSPQRTRQLILASGSKRADLESWLRDDFFRLHCQLFDHRPFIWQVWDGRSDGFSALVNYHRLNRQTLEKLTYSYLGDWIERQSAGVREGTAGSEERFAAARALQDELKLILEGEPPHDIFVRWKSLAQQPIGWDPDVNDGVRVNLRPFIEAQVLRSKVNVKWGKDSGKNPDGSERFNDLHYTNAAKQAARGTSA